MRLITSHLQFLVIAIKRSGLVGHHSIMVTLLEN